MDVFWFDSLFLVAFYGGEEVVLCLCVYSMESQVAEKIEDFLLLQEFEFITVLLSGQ